MNNIFKKIVQTEKSFDSAGKSKYTFIVSKDTEKDEIKSACEELFKVTVLDVNTMNYQGKVKMTKRVIGKRMNFKKAVVTVKKGEKIDLFEIETPEDKKAKKSASKQISK